jgi:hypothetical protein
MTIWEFHRVLTGRLFRLNLINVLAGLILQRSGRFLGGIGTQAVGWGVINIAIALIGAALTRRRYHRLDDPYDASLVGKERRSLRRLLIINAGLDILYILGGYHLVNKQGKTSESVRGHGWGIMIQGALLFVFDLIHAFVLPDHSTPKRASTRSRYTPEE